MGLPLHRIRRISAAVVCATLVACGGNLKTEQEDDGGFPTEDTLEGTADVLVARYKDRAEPLYYLQTDDGLHIRIFFEVDAGVVQPGERLSLAGHWNNEKALATSTFTATGVLKHLGVDHAAGGSGSGSSNGGVLAAASSGRRAPMLHRVAAILLGTPKYTRAQVLAQINQTPGSAGSFITENSDGIDAFEGDVFGPYNVNISDCGNRHYEIANLAKAAAAAEGKDLSRYTNIAILLPAGTTCGWGGLGQVGSPGSTGQKLTWYNNWFDCSVVAHELGHNLGFNHSHSTACGSSLYTAKRTGCTDTEYGDVFDVMGAADCSGGHYNAPQKQYMGWLDECEDVTAGGNAVFNLSPLEGDCGVRSLRIPIPGETSYYYLEYRKRSAGAFGGAQGADRVVLSVSNDGNRVRPDPYRLDSTPQSSSGVKDAWLAVGSSYSLPGNVQIKVLEIADVARVQVNMPSGAGATCHNGEIPATDASGRFGVGCADGCPSDPNKTAPGFCGCGVADVDTDKDGTRDCVDRCPSDANKTEPGVCGCGVLELTCAALDAGLVRKHYTGTWSTLPNFAEYKADGETVVSAINVSSYAGQDNFGVVFTGGVQIATAATYDFELGSDDGSRLRIDGRDVVLHDGLHGFSTKTGSIALSAGPHAIQVEFFEAGGGENLRLRYRRNGAAFVEIPSTLLVHPKAPSTDQCPNDPSKTAPGLCGCGVADTDSDKDGTPNCKDSCQTDANKTAPGTCGCGVADTDSDKDRVADCKDLCPTDPAKTAPGTCGCGKAEGSCGGTTASQCVLVNESATAQLACPSGQTIASIQFASYGTPTGTCGSFTASSCDATTSDSVVEAACLGKASCAVPATNTTFGDPCAGTQKRLAVAYVCKAAALPGLQRSHYRGTFSALPAFATLTPDASDVAATVALGPYAGTELFGLVFTGQINIASTGTYEFELGSDDGSRLEIDGAQVVNNDGVHPFKLVSGSVNLAAGSHTIRVEYFERTGGDNVRLSFRPAGGTLIEVPASVLFH